jgi:hypothetical protein
MIVAPARLLSRRDFFVLRGVMTREDVVTITGMFLLLGIAAAWFDFYALQTDRYKITEFCKPRGYKGGFIRNGHDFGCVASDGRKVLIRDIQNAETPKRQDRLK